KKVQKERQEYVRIQRACGAAARVYADKNGSSMGSNTGFSAKLISIGDYQNMQTKNLLKQELIKRIGYHITLLERHLPSDRYFKYLFFMKVSKINDPKNLRQNILQLSQEILTDVQNNRFKNCSDKINMVLNV